MDWLGGCGGLVRRGVVDWLGGVCGGLVRRGCGGLVRRGVVDWLGGVCAFVVLIHPHTGYGDDLQTAVNKVGKLHYTVSGVLQH